MAELEGMTKSKGHSRRLNHDDLGCFHSWHGLLSKTLEFCCWTALRIQSKMEQFWIRQLPLFLDLQNPTNPDGILLFGGIFHKG